MTRFMQVMLDGKPTLVTEEQFNSIVLRAQFKTAMPEPEQRQQPEPQDDEDDPAAWRGK